VKLTVGGKDYTQSVKVLKDPHSNGTEGDIQIQTRLMTSLTGTMNNMVDVVNQIESLRAQLLELKSALGSEEASASVPQRRRPAQRQAGRHRGRVDSVEGDRPRAG
jgi:hypothetical protein